jgi:stage V sporulation protein K
MSEIGLASLVGQESLKKRFYSGFASAPPDAVMSHQLFIGPPGIGKATFAKAIAHELSVAVTTISVDNCTKRLDLQGLIGDVARREVVILENIEDLPDELEESLLQLFEHRIEILIGAGPGARTHSIALPEFSMIATCSNPDNMLDSVWSLFSKRVTTFEPYSKSEFKVLLQTMQTHALERLTNEEQRWTLGAGSRFQTFIEGYSSEFVPGNVTNAVESFIVPPDAMPLRLSSSGPRKCAPVDASAEASAEDDLTTALDSLNKMTGLAAVKEEVNSLVNLIRMQTLRERSGLSNDPVSLHLVFTGNPGTGKTTVARMLGRIYKGLGVLSKGQVIEVDREGLVGGYVGHTAIKTKEAIERALDGVLFIDEAYSLANEYKQDFGHEAIDSLLKAMEDNRDRLAVIVAGYTANMKTFIQSNPGLKSRFDKVITFEDYSLPELYEIFRKTSHAAQYELHPDVERRVLSLLISRREESSDNARGIRNLLEASKKRHANRLAKISNPSFQQITTLEATDIPVA